MTDIHDAWEQVHAAKPVGWFVGRPNQRHGGEWAMYAFDQTEKAHIGRRSREWTAIAMNEVDCLVEMARCLAEIGEGRVPK
jgi:hypothetical protein